MCWWTHALHVIMVTLTIAHNVHTDSDCLQHALGCSCAWLFVWSFQHNTAPLLIHYVIFIIIHHHSEPSGLESSSCFTAERTAKERKHPHVQLEIWMNYMSRHMFYTSVRVSHSLNSVRWENATSATLLFWKTEWEWKHVLYNEPFSPDTLTGFVCEKGLRERYRRTQRGTENLKPSEWAGDKRCGTNNSSSSERTRREKLTNN